MPGVLPTPLLTTGGGGVALALDASSPPLVVANATTVATASFTPPVGSLLVVFALGTSFSGNPNAVVTSSGLTFTSQLLNNGAGEGTAQCFTSEVGGAGGSARTVTLNVSGYASCGLKVYVITGQHATLYVDNTSSGTSTANVINAAITTANDGCLVLGGGSEFIGLGVPTTTDAGEGLDDATGGVAYLAPRRAGETVKAGPELVNFDANGTGAASWYWILISIRPAAYTAPAVGKTADRGQISNITSQSSTAVDLPAAGSITTGNYLIARVAMDNSGTSGVARTLSVSDTRSNTWTVTTGANRTAGAANDGSTCYIAYAKVVNAYTNGDDLTFAYSGAVVAKAINVEEWYGIDGTTPLAVAATTATGSSATPSIARTPLAAGQLFYGAISSEGPATDAFTEDTDTTDGGWVTQTRVASASATAASNQAVYGVAKLVTGTTAQTWNPNIGTSRDWAQVALVFAPAAGGGITGTIAATQADNTAAATGKLGYSGTAAPAQANQTSAMSGTVVNPVTGTVAASQASNTAAASGQLGYSGTIAVTQANQVAASSGQLGYSGTVSSTQANQTAAISGTVGSGISGTIAATQAANTAVATGHLGYSGTAAPTQANQTAAVVGKLGYSGTVAASQANQASAISGQLGYSGTAAPAQANQTAAISGTFTSAGSFTGTIAATQANQTASATGKLGYSGTITPIQASNTAAASGTVVNPVTGAIAATQANQTASAVGVLRYTGTISVSQGSNTAALQGIVFIPITGVIAATQANQTAAISGSALGATVIRPNTGTTSRPGSGRTTRPFTGVTPQP